MDVTFCPADNCKKRATCPRYLSDQVKKDAEVWWGGEDAPIAYWTKPEELECYEPEKVENR